MVGLSAEGVGEPKRRKGDRTIRRHTVSASGPAGCGSDPTPWRAAEAALAGGDGNGSSPDQVAITYFTDPLCCWSWAMEPQWRRLRYEFGDRVRCRVRMGGLLADWQSFHDPITAVSRPGQMGPHWFAAARASGMPIDERVWMEDPPASSYPACLAVKAAELQGGTAGARYLRRLREAVMLERR